MKTGLTDVKTSQDEMKTGFSDKIKSVQEKLTQGHFKAFPLLKMQ